MSCCEDFTIIALLLLSTLLSKSPCIALCFSTGSTMEYALFIESNGSKTRI